MNDRLLNLAHRLRAPIPPPAPKPVKPRKSFAGLKPGDTLIDRDSGIAWTVASCDSEGASLVGFDEVGTKRRLGNATPWQERFIKLTKRQAAKRLEGV